MSQLTIDNTSFLKSIDLYQLEIPNGIYRMGDVRLTVYNSKYCVERFGNFVATKSFVEYNCVFRISDNIPNYILHPNPDGSIYSVSISSPKCRGHWRFERKLDCENSDNQHNESNG